MSGPFCWPRAVLPRAARPSGAPVSGEHGALAPRSHHHDHTHFIGQTPSSRCCSGTYSPANRTTPSRARPRRARSSAHSNYAPAPNGTQEAATSRPRTPTASAHTANASANSQNRPSSPTAGSWPTGKPAAQRRWVRARHRGAHLEGPRKAKPRDGLREAPDVCSSLRQSPAPNHHDLKGSHPPSRALDFHPSSSSTATPSQPPEAVRHTRRQPHAARTSSLQHDRDDVTITNLRDSLRRKRERRRTRGRAVPGWTTCSRRAAVDLAPAFRGASERTRATAARASEPGRSSYWAVAVSWVSPVVLSAAWTRRASSSMRWANWVTASSAPSSPQPAT